MLTSHRSSLSHHLTTLVRLQSTISEPSLAQKLARRHAAQYPTTTFPSSNSPTGTLPLPLPTPSRSRFAENLASVLRPPTSGAQSVRARAGRAGEDKYVETARENRRAPIETTKPYPLEGGYVSGRPPKASSLKEDSRIVAAQTRSYQSAIDFYAVAAKWTKDANGNFHPIGPDSPDYLAQLGAARKLFLLPAWEQLDSEKKEEITKTHLARIKVSYVTELAKEKPSKSAVDPETLTPEDLEIRARMSHARNMAKLRKKFIAIFGEKLIPLDKRRPASHSLPILPPTPLETTATEPSPPPTPPVTSSPPSRSPKIPIPTSSPSFASASSSSPSSFSLRFQSPPTPLLPTSFPPLSSYPLSLSTLSTPLSPLIPTDPSLPPVPIAKLSHGLDRVLFNPGVHFLKDPRTGVYNFSKSSLEGLPTVEEFAFEKLPRYVTASKDEVLMKLAKEEGKTFVGSTSSTVALLCQIYFWLSKGKGVNLSMLSSNFANSDTSFSAGQRLPASVTLHYKDGRYAIDADKSMDTGGAAIETNILASYGHLMEKLLTTEPDEFSRFLADSPDPAPSQADNRQAYHYTQSEHMILRSQLDAHNEFLPNRTFDVKTRGTVAVRQDRLNYVEAAGYTIDRLTGEFLSFEREYYDLIRSAFLKYTFQARIGAMDGCLIAYHSTARFFGFQYVPIEEMDVALFGHPVEGEFVYRLCVAFLEKILMRATGVFERESVRVTLAVGEKNDVLRIFVHPLAGEGVAKSESEGDVVEGEVEGEVKGEVEVEEGGSGMKHEEKMTLLELRGTNYVNGVPQLWVDFKSMLPKHSGTVVEKLPLWEVGYRFDRHDGYEVVEKVQEEGGDAVSSDAIFVDNVPVDSTLPATPPPSPPTPTSSHPTLTRDEIHSAFTQVRSHQSMFNSIALPSGIKTSDIASAELKVASLSATPAESALAAKFPTIPGFDYRNSPSRGVLKLRAMAVSGRKREEKEEREREREGRGESVVQLKTVVEVH